MQILITGKNARNIAELVKSLGFEIVTSDPDVIISYGGDGTLLTSEREYPGILKLPMRDSAICKKCPDHQEEILLKSLLEEKLQIKEYSKLETIIFYNRLRLHRDASCNALRYQTLLALNDFVIRNVTPVHAIRFSTSCTNEKLLIGDGVVIATPFGSTGYFKSITEQAFDKGLPAGRQGWGLAFNNTTEKIPPLFLKDEDTATFKLVRGQATLSFDNNPDIFNVDESSELTFKLSNQAAKIYEANSLRCPRCKIRRG